MVSSQGFATLRPFTFMVIIKIVVTHGVGTIDHEPATVDYGMMDC
jgi:hypothetical protein